MSSSQKKIVLISSHGEIFEVEEAVALESPTIKCLMEDNPTDDNVISLPNVTGEILGKVIEYLKKHVAGNNDGKDGTYNSFKNLEWDGEFVKVDKDTLFQLVIAANFLGIKGLLELTCKAVADHMKTMSVEEMRQYFHISNDFSPQEEAENRRENPWAFE